ncbi:MAG: beta-propeller domain-containing protein [Myxococcales bacterium]|nr:beta-propeller domain-containing protein [Myxococcales bacterium]
MPRLRPRLLRSIHWLGLVVLLLGCAARERPRLELEQRLGQGVDDRSRRALSTFESPRALVDYLEQVERARTTRSSELTPDELAAESGEDLDGVAVYDFADDDITGQLAPSGALVATQRSITNVQEVGVDEGGIVKLVGEHLVVLRRGRLFSVDISRRRIRPVDAIDVSPRPGHFAWYDEMLVVGNTVLVVGYSYDTQSSELLRFRLGADGHWRRLDGWMVRSSDYYSSRNYASRLVGDHLVMYTQGLLRVHQGRVSLPAVARWDGARIRRRAWAEVMEATDIQRPVLPTRDPVLHAIIDCELRTSPLRCRAQGMVGPASRSYYVSGRAVYVWLHERASAAEPDAALYRLSFGGSAPGALLTWGMPIDQFSFLERDGMLAVLVSLTGRGDGMLGPEQERDEPLALMRVPVSALASGLAKAEPEAFVDLGLPPAEPHALVDRFVGDHLLFGPGDPWYDAPRAGSTLSVVRYVDPSPPVQTLELPHAVDRIEALGSDALVIGGRGEDLLMSSIALGAAPRRVAEHVQPGAAQGETRSHGFFFSPRGPRRGLLGLPLRPGDQLGWAHLVDGAKGVGFMAVDDLHLSSLGALVEDPWQAELDDRCDSSCVDWYGSARPLFIGDRIFALLGYELVEGRVSHGRIQELTRTNLLWLVDGVRSLGT